MNHLSTEIEAHDRFMMVKKAKNPERIVNITINNFDGGYQVGRYFSGAGSQKGSVPIRQ